MKRPNGAVIWLLLAGAMMGFSLSLICAYFLQGGMYLIPVFLILVVAGYLTARMIGKAGGELSERAKSFAIILEGLVLGVAFDLIRLRHDWIINIFKYIALGSFFVLIALSLRRNLEDYLDETGGSELHLGIMRPSILFILAGFSFAIGIASIAESFLFSGFYIPLLILLAVGGLASVMTANPDYNLLQEEASTWYKLMAGATMGIAYDLVIFRVVLWQDLLKLTVACLVFAITAMVIRMKESTKMTSSDEKGITLEFADKKESKQKGRSRFSKTSRRKKSSKKK
ncbi:MAG: hypothetical protein GF308_16575 [Candidatus Heimdallarchaeota archaeon]|nr:hypothetical protein [Candidatus Heimdallarchaeota archaeon]